MSFILRAVGDVAASSERPAETFRYVGDTLRDADLTFCQNERLYVKDETVESPDGITLVTSPENAQSLTRGGFDVVSFASNHSMDVGPEPMSETVDVLESLGFEVVGVGANSEEAREPVILERDGTRIGFLAYCSILKDGHEATDEEPGVAPMRAWTHYQQIDYQPGTPPKIHTFPYRDDLKTLLEDVRKLREEVDILILSMHWGVHFETATIADYQVDVAHKAIDAGADVILGTHPHIVKGVEVYKNKPIFYSLGNFAFEHEKSQLNRWKEESEHFRVLLDLYDWDLDEGYDKYAFPPESRKSMLVELEVDHDTVESVGIYPVQVNEDAQPVLVPEDSEEFDSIFRYLRDVTAEEELGTDYRLVDGRIDVPLDQ